MSPIRRYAPKFALLIAMLSLPVALPSPLHAATEKVIYNFAAIPDGHLPVGPLTADSQGNFYGTTDQGGNSNSVGTVFELSPDGHGGWSEKVLYSFCSVGGASCLDGAYPLGSELAIDGMGNLYGTTYSGGTGNWGTVFELSPEGEGWSEKVLYNFTGQLDGSNPQSGVILDSSGNLYGTNPVAWGTNGGVVFKLSPSENEWTYTVIYGIEFINAQYFTPGLVMDGNGNLFGAAGLDVFELTPNGGAWDSTILHTFPGSGYAFEGTPVLDQSGDIYGTMMHIAKRGRQWKSGEVYQLTRKNGVWKSKTLYSWPSGTGPRGGVVLDSSGNVYGANFGGGTYGQGRVFELLKPAKGNKYSERDLWNFCDLTPECQNSRGGALPLDGVILSGGNLYGTTSTGGTTNGGVIFEIIP